MATSQRKIDANRRNAKRSTGPKTPRGNAFSSRNSISHGLTAKTLCIGDESPADFDRLLAEFTADHQPANRTEMEFVETLALSSWRIRRANRYEIDILQKRVEHGLKVGDSDYRDATVASRPAVAFGDIALRGSKLRDLHRQEQRLRRAWLNAYSELAQIHKARRKEAQKRTNEPKKSPEINTGVPVRPNSAPPAAEPAATAPPPPEPCPSPTQSSLILFCCLLLSLLRNFFSNVLNPARLTRLRAATAKRRPALAYRTATVMERPARTDPAATFMERPLAPAPVTNPCMAAP